MVNKLLGGGFKYFLFFCSPLFGEMIQFDEHIFQMGGKNHQLDLDLEMTLTCTDSSVEACKKDKGSPWRKCQRILPSIQNAVSK